MIDIFAAYGLTASAAIMAPERERKRDIEDRDMDRPTRLFRLLKNAMGKGNRQEIRTLSVEITKIWIAYNSQCLNQIHEW